MKKIYILLFAILSLQSFSQKDNSRYYNSWRLGLNLGGAWQTADYRSCWGMAGGLTLERGFHENSTNFFSFAIRGRYLAANTYGMDYSRNYDIKDNDAYNGVNDPKVNYVDSMPLNRRYVYDNYKMTLGEGSLELQLTFNRLRERTGVILNLWGGVGITSYRTKSDLLDGNNKMYDFSKIDSTGNQSKALNKYNSLIDKKYESNALGSKNGNLVTFSPSLGVGLGYQFSPGFSMLWEYKVTFPQGSNADLLDGKYGNNGDAVAGSNDYYHYTGLNLVFTLRGKNKTKTVKDETVYTNTVVTTNTVGVPTNSIAPPTNTTVVVNQPKPIVTYITPSVNGQITNNAQYKISAQVLNVTNANQIQFKMNGSTYSNFTYNTQTHVLDYYATLQLGYNTVQIVATNAYGVDNESTIVVFENPKPVGNPPTVTITNPSSCPAISKTDQYMLMAYISNVNLKKSITVKINNVVNLNFNFNPTTGQLDMPLTLVNGNNSIVVSASNTYGNDSKSCVINCTKPLQTMPPPVITILNPPQNAHVVATQSYLVKAQVLNIVDQSGASVYLNGLSVPFVYDAATKQISFTASLKVGSNPISIYASNTAGDDSKATDIIYTAPAVTGVPPVVSLINPNQQNTTTSIQSANLKLSVLNVNSKADINVTVNGSAVAKFVYNAATKEVDFGANLIIGNNIMVVKGTNAYGTDSKTIYINYVPKIEAKNPPIVTITGPATAQETTAILNYIFKAVINNVPTKSGLVVKLNGAAITTYAYDGYTIAYAINLIQGNNTFEVTATNNDGTVTKSAVVIYQPKAVPTPPVVNLINPAIVNNTTNNVAGVFKFSVLNVATKNDVSLTFNGVNQTNFTYNTTTADVDFATNLIVGNNTIVVKGTNQFGSDSKTIYVNYIPKVEAKNPPVVTITNPLNTPGVTALQNYSFKATVSNVPTQAGLVVKVNGAVVTNYTYNGYNVNCPATLIQGNNTFEVTATNNDGTVAKSSIVNYKPKEVPTPPIVNLINPAQVMNATDNVAATFKLSVLNVTTKNDIEVTFNGTVQTNFTYNAVTKEVDFLSNLIAGNNTLVVKGTNQFGTDSKQIIVVYTPRVELKSPPAVTITNPAVSPSSTQDANIDFNATIENMPTSKGITVKFNGAVVTNFTYNGHNLSYPTVLMPGNNTFEVMANNKDGSDQKTATVNYKQKVVPTPPIVNLINPALKANATDNAFYVFKLSVLNVTSKNDIEVLMNGAVFQNFTYNTAAKEIDFSVTLVEGDNIFSVKGTNQFGSNSKQINVRYTPQAVVKNPPVIAFTNPSGNVASVQAPNYLFNATISNVTSSAGLVVKYNGNVVSNFNYDGANLVYNASLIQGSNSLEITATNNDGSDVKNAVVNYTPKIVVARPPVVTILNPSHTMTVTDGVFNFQFKATNVGQNQIQVFLNGVPMTQFTFASTIGNFSGTLLSGNNTVMVKATNNDGTDSKTAVVIYEAKKEEEPKDTTASNPHTDEIKKITICHIPPGNNQNPQTIVIPITAWQAHQAHGDVMGECPPATNKTSPKINPRINPNKTEENNENQQKVTPNKTNTEETPAPNRPR